MSGQTVLNKSSNYAHHLRYDFCIFLCDLLNYRFGSVSVYAECNYNYRQPASVISSVYSSFTNIVLGPQMLIILGYILAPGIGLVCLID